MNDPRRPSERNNDSKKVNRELLDKIKRVKPNCGFFCLLSGEKRDQNKNEIISPIKEHPVSLTEIFDRAKRIKRNLMVTDQERQNIALATKVQSNCQAWFEHRRVRITHGSYRFDDLLFKDFSRTFQGLSTIFKESISTRTISHFSSYSKKAISVSANKSHTTKR